MTEPMKTAEEILRAKFSGLSHKIVTPVHPVQKTLIVAAMQEYADQEKSAERERIKKKLGKSIIEHEYELDFPGDPVINVSVLFKLIDSL